MKIEERRVQSKESDIATLAVCTALAICYIAIASAFLSGMIDAMTALAACVTNLSVDLMIESVREIKMIKKSKSEILINE